jgi:hypothetical protein
MLESIIISTNICFSYTILSSSISENLGLWYFLLFLFIIGIVFASIVLLIYSKKPEDWKHESVTENFEETGRLKDLAGSIKLSSADYSTSAPINNLIKTVFFEKVYSVKGSFSSEEYKDLYGKDRGRLMEILGDGKIVDWILDFNEKKTRGISGGFLGKNYVSKKGRYLNELNNVLDKMEAWGE